MAQVQSSQFRVFPFILASTVSAALILAAPFIGEIRRLILLRFPDQYVRIVGGIALLAVGSAVLTALVRIRDRRGWRYLALAASVIGAASYAYVTRTADPQQNAVERFHFVEYGLVAWLFYRAWRPAGDLSAILMPVLAGLLVGSLEEWFQWFIPARVGEVRDVFLNGVAIACGLIFSVALHPLDRSSMKVLAASWRRLGVFAAVVLIVFAAFFQSVHIGHVISGDGWSFRSAYTSTGLTELAADRTARWRNTFFERPKRLSAEDQYMTEGLWHVLRRNTTWAGQDYLAAWAENQILERYFAPVLDTPSYVSKTGHRWSAEHRADAEGRFKERQPAAPYESQAHPSAIFAWPKTLYWMVIAAIASLLAWPWVRHRRRSGRAAATIQPL